MLLLLDFCVFQRKKRVHSLDFSSWTLEHLSECVACQMLWQDHLLSLSARFHWSVRKRVSSGYTLASQSPLQMFFKAERVRAWRNCYGNRGCVIYLLIYVFIKTLMSLNGKSWKSPSLRRVVLLKSRKCEVLAANQQLQGPPVLWKILTYLVRLIF